MTRHPPLKLHRIGIDTYLEPVIYMRADCPACRSEGLEVHARVHVTFEDRSIIATLNTVDSAILGENTAGLSEYAWQLLGAREGGEITIRHALPVSSFDHVRGKIYGHDFTDEALQDIIRDITEGRYTDIFTSAFVTICAGRRMADREITALTNAMVDAGDRLEWPQELIVDKHCVGGLPGNRTTPIVVSIVSAFGLTIPKTSSRAITSPAGTADTMEVLAPVNLGIDAMRRVVEREGGCVIWGGAMALSPADDIIIRVEKTLDLDSEGQMVASILSKKIAAGSNHVLIDMPIGPTAKIRSAQMAGVLENYLRETAQHVGLRLKIHFSDGRQPVGNGIGPALEARDILKVLQNSQDAPVDLRERALALAGKVIEFAPGITEGQGYALARAILDDGRAWRKFRAICEAQGGMREIPRAARQHEITAGRAGIVTAIDNRRIARVAKLAGAPREKAAGVDLHVKLGERVEAGQPLYTIHAEAPGQLDYALDYLALGNHVIDIGEPA